MWVVWRLNKLWESVYTLILWAVVVLPPPPPSIPPLCVLTFGLLYSSIVGTLNLAIYYILSRHLKSRRSKYQFRVVGKNQNKRMTHSELNLLQCCFFFVKKKAQCADALLLLAVSVVVWLLLTNNQFAARVRPSKNEIIGKTQFIYVVTFQFWILYGLLWYVGKKTKKPMWRESFREFHLNLIKMYYLLFVHTYFYASQLPDTKR